MKLVLASYGTRGDIEPCVALACELRRRGHEVRTAVPPDLTGFAESAGLQPVAYGSDVQAALDVHRDFWTALLRRFWKIRDVVRLWRKTWEISTQSSEEMSRTLMSLSNGADLLLTGISFQEGAANVAEYYDIPLATLHTLPMRANGELIPFLPEPLTRSGMRLYEWATWRTGKKGDDAQRRELGLPKATGPLAKRIEERGSLEIQAYDEVCFPGLAAEWAERGVQRPFVGALTLELGTDIDDEVMSWIAGGTPPIFFSFGSIPVESAADTLAMIGAACAQLGERALVCTAGTDCSHVPHMAHVKVVDAVGYAAVLPACRAVVHHGGAGTTAAGLRAGVPTLVLSTILDQTLWGLQIKRLKVGDARRFSTTTREKLVSDLRRILAPEYVARAREISVRMTKPADSVAAAADHVENLARLKSVR